MNRTTLGLPVIALLSLFTFACGGGESASTAPPSDPEVSLVELPPIEVAGAAVSEAPELGEYNFPRAAFSLPMQASMLKGAALESAEDLEKGGWVFLDPAGNLILTSKAEGDKRFIPRDNGSLDIVPLARKEFVSVDGLGHDDEGDVTVDFTWHWVPNEVAQSFERGAIATRFDGDQRARATIYPTRDGWKILRIVEIEQPEEGSTDEQPAGEESPTGT